MCHLDSPPVERWSKSDGHSSLAPPTPRPRTVKDLSSPTLPPLSTQTCISCKWLGRDAALRRFKPLSLSEGATDKSILILLIRFGGKSTNLVLAINLELLINVRHTHFASDGKCDNECQ